MRRHLFGGPSFVRFDEAAASQQRHEWFIGELDELIFQAHSLRMAVTNR